MCHRQDQRSQGYNCTWDLSRSLLVQLCTFQERQRLRQAQQEVSRRRRALGLAVGMGPQMLPHMLPASRTLQNLAG